MHSDHIAVVLVGVATIWMVLLDAFETVVLPRRVLRNFRLTAYFIRRTWIPWRGIARRIRKLSRQQNFLGYFGPLSLILLLGLWAAGLIFGFALIQYGIGGHEQLSGEPLTFGKILYHSGETFFTLGYGDIVPTSPAARALSVFEAGMGFAFLGVVVGYIPVAYTSFSRREVQISLLDARAGSPPSASELLVNRGLIKERSMKFCGIGSAGARNYWRPRSRIPCSRSSARSTAISPGSPRLPPCST